MTLARHFRSSGGVARLSIEDLIAQTGLPDAAIGLQHLRRYCWLVSSADRASHSPLYSPLWLITAQQAQADWAGRWLDRRRAARP